MSTEKSLESIVPEESTNSTAIVVIHTTNSLEAIKTAISIVNLPNVDLFLGDEMFRKRTRQYSKIRYMLVLKDNVSDSINEWYEKQEAKEHVYVTVVDGGTISSGVLFCSSKLRTAILESLYVSSITKYRLYMKEDLVFDALNELEKGVNNSKTLNDKKLYYSYISYIKCFHIHNCVESYDTAIKAMECRCMDIDENVNKEFSQYIDSLQHFIMSDLLDGTKLKTLEKLINMHGLHRLQNTVFLKVIGLFCVYMNLEGLNKCNEVSYEFCNREMFEELYIIKYAIANAVSVYSISTSKFIYLSLVLKMLPLEEFAVLVNNCNAKLALLSENVDSFKKLMLDLDNLNISSTLTHTKLGDKCMSFDMKEHAIEYYRRAITFGVEGDKSLAYYKTATVLKATDKRECYFLLKNAIKTYKGRDVSYLNELYYQIGYIVYQTNPNYGDALSYFNKYLHIYNRNPDIYFDNVNHVMYQIAVIYTDKKDFEKAYYYLNESFLLCDDDDELIISIACDVVNILSVNNELVEKLESSDHEFMTRYLHFYDLCIGYYSKMEIYRHLDGYLKVVEAHTAWTTKSRLKLLNTLSQKACLKEKIESFKLKNNLQ